VWGEIAKAARAEREKMRGTHPPGRSGPQAKAHGGKRPDSGRKKAIYKKVVLNRITYIITSQVLIKPTKWGCFDE